MTVRWGIAGPGGIAVGFANGLQLLDDAEIYAIGSRSADRAADFAAQYGASASYGSYEGLAADPGVDAVYVATPQSRHEQDTLMFLEAGKPVLCEKPFALNQAQSQRMIDAARERGLLLMEAMWSRFLPAYRVLADLLGEQAIGEPQLVEADFGFHQPFDPDHRLYDPERGGGRNSRPWACIPCSSPHWCWARRPAWRPRAESARPESTSRWLQSWATLAASWRW